ncbi:GDSL esterase/lipase [Senna tora]|uniref:GDSL esterase/lipase n=1 Tax=Senna tora TaxID=362788 RepID=A0A834WVP1_9FABA|nr:GDSL esterase/lipase [Senna tora]
MAKSGRSGTTKEKVEDEEAPHHHHPYAFHVCGPRNFTTLTWRDLLNSSCHNKFPRSFDQKIVTS